MSDFQNQYPGYQGMPPSQIGEWAKKNLGYLVGGASVAGAVLLGVVSANADATPPTNEYKVVGPISPGASPSPDSREGARIVISDPRPAPETRDGTLGGVAIVLGGVGALGILGNAAERFYSRKNRAASTSARR